MTDVMDTVEKLGATEDYMEAYRRGIRVGRAELEREVAEWMIAHSIPIGHGDTLKALLGELLCYFIDRASAETARCAEIVQMARFAEIDQDWRTVIHFIEGGMSVDQIKATLGDERNALVDD